MSAKILVGYATRSGSTPEVAEEIAKNLRTQGFEVDVQAVRDVRSLEGYQAAILGAPLYIMRWHRDMRSFLSRQRKALAALPVAIFALGPWHNKEEELKSAREQLDKELAKYSWLQPVTKETFVGKFDPAKLGFPFSLIGPLKNMPASDERDWDVIRSWASDVAETLQTRL